MAKKIRVQLLPGFSEEEHIRNIDQVMGELDHFRKEARRFKLHNSLHGQLAGAMSLAGMVREYSFWLMPLVEHDLVGYSNLSREKKYLFCTTHGPERKKALFWAEKALSQAEDTVGELDGIKLYCHVFQEEGLEGAGLFCVVKQGREMSQEERETFLDSLAIVKPSLLRALEYEDLVEQASKDALTGLANRRTFKNRIYAMMDSAKRYNTALTMLSMDLDNFKKINDSLGHMMGDEVLKAVASTLQNAVRSTDLLVRMGGDEFLLILGNTDQQNANILAKRLCKAIEELNIWADDATKLGISIGLTQLGKDQDLEDWLEKADGLLYMAKKKKRSWVAEG